MKVYQKKKILSIAKAIFADAMIVLDAVSIGVILLMMPYIVVNGFTLEPEWKTAIWTVVAVNAGAVIWAASEYMCETHRRVRAGLIQPEVICRVMRGEKL